MPPAAPGKVAPWMKQRPTPFEAAAIEIKQSDGTLAWSKAYHEKVVIVVNQFSCRGKALAQCFAQSADHGTMLRVEFFEVLFRRVFGCRREAGRGGRAGGGGVGLAALI